MHRDPKAPTETSRGLVHTELDLASAEFAAQTLTPRGEGRWDAGGTEGSREGKMKNLAPIHFRTLTQCLYSVKFRKF